MSPSHLCILNCVEDAKDFIRMAGGARTDWTLVSTHGSVNDFLATKGIDCHELSSYVSDRTLISLFGGGGASAAYLLHRLDELLAEEISRVLDVPPMNYFYPLYIYPGKYECLNMLKLKSALDVLCRQKRFDLVYVYESRPTGYIGGWSLADSVRRFSGLPVKEGTTRAARNDRVETGSGRAAWRVRRAFRNPDHMISKLHNRLSQRFFRKIDEGRQVVVLLEPLYDLSFLMKEIADCNTIIWPYQYLPRVRGLQFQPDASACMRIAALVERIDVGELQRFVGPDLEAFPRIVLDHFLENLEANTAAVQCLDNLYRRCGVSLAAWGNSPVWGSRCLLVEYLLQVGVPVVGMQHGGSYVVQHCASIHFDSDFERCTHFLSYGFTDEDLRKTYPAAALTCQVIPAGSYRELVERKQRAAANDHRQTIDILFPVTESLSFFREAFRIRASQLNKYQQKLTEFLDGLTGVAVCIKPVPDYDENSCSTIEQFKKLRNARLLRHMTLTECLKRFKAKAAVIEYPSTPLFEVLGEDCEIFLLSDPILPFHKDALDLLKKRVHCFDDVESLKFALGAYLQGKIVPLRNDEFYEKYVARGGTKELILQTLNRLAKTCRSAFAAGGRAN